MPGLHEMASRCLALRLRTGEELDDRHAAPLAHPAEPLLDVIVALVRGPAARSLELVGQHCEGGLPKLGHAVDALTLLCAQVCIPAGPVQVAIFALVFVPLRDLDWG